MQHHYYSYKYKMQGFCHLLIPTILEDPKIILYHKLIN